MRCPLVRLDDGSVLCPVCRRPAKDRPDGNLDRIWRRCRLPGPGDMLHVLILRWVGQRPAAGCQCRQRIVLMNKWGPAGCREHFHEIVGWLVEQAKEHKWLATTIDAAGNEILSETSPPKIVRLTRWMMRSIPGGTIPVVVVCRLMVLAAIRKATQRRGQLRPED